MWPRPARWDVIDALAGMLFVLEEGERYFTPSDLSDDIEDEYDELDNEPPLQAIDMISSDCLSGPTTGAITGGYSAGFHGNYSNVRY